MGNVLFFSISTKKLSLLNEIPENCIIFAFENGHNFMKMSEFKEIKLYKVQRKLEILLCFSNVKLRHFTK